MSARAPFGYAQARQLASAMTSRLSGELIDAYASRQDAAAFAVLMAAATRGTAMNTFLTTGYRYVPVELHAAKLRSLAADVLSLAPGIETGLSLVPLANDHAFDERPILQLA